MIHTLIHQFGVFVWKMQRGESERQSKREKKREIQKQRMG